MLEVTTQRSILAVGERWRGGGGEVYDVVHGRMVTKRGQAVLDGKAHAGGGGEIVGSEGKKAYSQTLSMERVGKEISG